MSDHLDRVGYPPLRINSPALIATTALHALAVLVATYVATVHNERARPSISATMTFIDLRADRGSTGADLPPRPAAAPIPSVATDAQVDSQPAAAIAAAAATVAAGSGGFDPYAGATPVRLSAGARGADVAAARVTETWQDGPPPLDGGIAELRARVAGLAPGFHGDVVLRVLVGAAGTIEDIRIDGGTLASSLSRSNLADGTRGLQLFPAVEIPTLRWRTLPALRL